MRRHEISDDQWGRIEPLMPGRPGQHGGVSHDNRLFVNAIYYMAKTGYPWARSATAIRQMVYRYHRYNEWRKKGILIRIFHAIQDPDLEWLILDSTIISAHQHVAGLNTDECYEDLGRSRGGVGTKIHLAEDYPGNSTRIQLSPGQGADIKHTEPTIEGQKADAMISDKGYDSDRFVEAVIPPRMNRIHQ